MNDFDEGWNKLMLERQKDRFIRKLVNTAAWVLIGISIIGIIYYL